MLAIGWAILLVAIAWISLVCLAMAHLWRRLTGQFNVDDVED